MKNKIQKVSGLQNIPLKTSVLYILENSESLFCPKPAHPWQGSFSSLLSWISFSFAPSVSNVPLLLPTQQRSISIFCDTAVGLEGV